MDIPSIVTLTGVLLTLGVNLWLGISKHRIDTKTVLHTGESDLRDDLMQLVERYEKQLEFKETKLEQRDQQLQAAQAVIATQLEKITELSLMVRQLQFEVKELRIELEKFNRKVYYTREDKS